MKNSPVSEKPTATVTIDRQIALVLFAATIAIYLRMIAPGLLSGDSGEFQFAAWRLGLAHATGYPLYLLLGWAWQHLLSFVGISPATALNAFSALIGASSVALFYWLLLAWLPGEVLIRRLTALFAALFFAFTPTFWSQSLIAEVYTLQVLLLLLIFLSFTRSVTESQPTTRNPQLAIRNSQFFPLFLCSGLALTHHATTLFLAPGVVIGLFLARPNWWKSGRTVVSGLVLLLLPLLLYLYVPLRSGIDASPWYYLRLGETTIPLYGGGWQGFVDFVSGRSISVGFKSLGEAVATLPQAWTLWKLHFGWIGLVLMVIGLGSLVRSRNWTVLSLTLPFVLILQLFNLFYNIGDILVYYIPLYLVGVIWMAFGALAIGEVGRWGGGEKGGKGEGEKGGSSDSGAIVQAAEGAGRAGNTQQVGIFIVVLLFLLPMQAYRQYQPVLNQSRQDAARPMWQAILAAKPEPNAILVSDNRNEIVPLYYLQSVENFATSLTGLFPLITPDASFADVGATLDRALQSGQPVYLIKPMPGLEVLFDLAAANQPLVRVLGPAVKSTPQHAVGQPLGGLTLTGYDWQQNGETIQIDLYWLVNEKLAKKYTSTVQLFDAAGKQFPPSDGPPGGDFYPTNLWKPGELLLDRHALRLPAGQKPVKLLIGMYDQTNMSALAPPIEIDALP